MLCLSRDGGLPMAAAALIASTLIAVAGCSRNEAPAAVQTYVTEYGLGPDKWATAWLLTQRPDAQANLQVVPAGTALPEGTAFDVKNAAIRRIQSRAAFEVAKDALKLQDPTLDQLSAIVHQIEVNFWTDDGPVEADVVEHAYRELQLAHGRDQVTPSCYVAFFDRVYQVLRDARTRGVSFDPDRLNLGCDELTQIAHRSEQLIPEVPVSDVLSAMAAGRRVVFVDVREADEFAEGHIPGALNIPLREAGPHLAERFKGADYVVSYCVKDFRGFEMAKALADAGVANSVIMRPYGIKGWTALGLPVTGTRAMAEASALDDLQQCLAAHGECLAQRAKEKTT